MHYILLLIYIYTKNVANQTWKISRRKGTLLAKIIEKRQKFGEVEKDRESLSAAYDAVIGKYQRNAGNAFWWRRGKGSQKGKGIWKRGGKGVCVVRKYTHTHCNEKGSREKPNGKRMIFGGKENYYAGVWDLEAT